MSARTADRGSRKDLKVHTLALRFTTHTCTFNHSVHSAMSDISESLTTRSVFVFSDGIQDPIVSLSIQCVLYLRRASW